MTGNNNPRPFFSIIIPVFNEEKLLSNCLKSVFAQNFPSEKYEVIIVDNNSSDASMETASRFPLIIVKEKQQGIVAARDAGFKKARGKVIVNLDADCLVPGNWLKKIYRHFRSNKKLVALNGPCQHYDHDSFKTYPYDLFSCFLTKLVFTSEKLTGYPLGYWAGNAMIRKSVLEKIGGYDLNFAEVDQLSLFRRLNRHGQVHFDPTLKIKTSDRRTKGRWLDFIFEIISYFLNTITIKVFKRKLVVWNVIR